MIAHQPAGAPLTAQLADAGAIFALGGEGIYSCRGRVHCLVTALRIRFGHLPDVLRVSIYRTVQWSGQIVSESITFSGGRHSKVSSGQTAGWT